MWVKKFAEFALSGTVFEIQAFLCFAIFAKNSKIHLVGQNVFENRVFLLKLLYLARFSRCKHFCVLQFLQKIQNGCQFWWDQNFFENWVSYSAELPYGSKCFWQVKYSLKFGKARLHGYPVGQKFCRNRSIWHGFRDTNIFVFCDF